MEKNVYGCACCSPDMGKLFQGNRAVAALSAQPAAALIAGSGWLSGGPAVRRRDFVRGAAAAAGLAGLAPGALGAEEAPTTVFTGATVLTVDKSFAEAEALAIRGNRILAVGRWPEVRAAAGADAAVVDLGGRVVLPGFIDPHTHVLTGSLVDRVMDYVGMARYATAAEVLDHLGAKAAAAAPGTWIAARNFDPAIQEGPAALTFRELDAVSTDHPVFVLNASGHLAYANSRAFAAAGIPDDIADPPGAAFVRDADGRLNGVMKNQVAFMQVFKSDPALAAADPVETLIGLTRKFSRLGLTTVSDLGLGVLSQGPGDLAILSKAGDSGRLAARIRAYPFYPYDAAWDEAGLEPGAGNEMVRIVGYKLVADGSNQGFTGLQRAPYLNSDSVGLAYTAPEELTRLAVKRARQGWQLAIHGNGDKAIDNVLDACEAVRDAGIDMAGVRARIEHCSILHDDQIARMKALGVSASFLIGHVHFWGVAMRDEVFGPKKAELLDRCRSCERAGVGFTLHSDFMVTDPDPLHMIEMAVTRRTWKEPEYVLAPDERISVESAIRAITSEAAWQLHSEHEVGSLEAGKLADFVVLDRDPRTVAPDAIKDIRVLETWMNGERVFRA